MYKRQFQYRTLLSVSASLGLPYHLVTGDVRQANYSSLRAELVEFRRRVEQLQHGVIAHQLCRPVWARWLETAVLSGALDLPDFARSPARYRPVNWIPPRWDWVDPLKAVSYTHLEVYKRQALVRSRLMSRSNCATAARTVEISSPAGVVVSSCSLRDRSYMPRARMESTRWRRSRVDRPSRSRHQTRKTSPDRA